MKEQVEVKKKLVNLYENKIDDFELIYDKYGNQDINGPLLMSPSSIFIFKNSFFSCRKRNSCGWEQFNIGINELLSCYERFNVGESYNKKGSPLWYLVRFTKDNLEIVTILVCGLI